jgi:hypothetical protein
MAKAILQGFGDELDGTEVEIPDHLVSQPLESKNENELFKALDKISVYNELGGRGHGDLKDACYICGISPKALKHQIQELIAKDYTSNSEVEQQVLIGRIDEVKKYDDHNAIQMAKFQGDYNHNGSITVLKAKGYGSPYAKERLATLKAQLKGK